MNLRLIISILLLSMAGSAAFAQKTDTSSNRPKPPRPVMKIETAPQFPGGMAKAYEYISANFNYPKGITPRPHGKIVISFTVDYDGSIKDVVAREKVHPLLDEEAVRVIQGMPKWAPGIQNGRPVKVVYNLPITLN